MSIFGGANDGGAAAQEAQRQANITAGTATLNKEFAGFDNNFYQKAADDYTSYATPQLMNQFGTTRNDLTYALARAGLSNSGTAVAQNASLQKQLAVNQSDIANTAADRSNTLQANVNTTKGQLQQQLESSGDPSAVSEQAVGAVSQLRAPSAIQPLGNMFADWTNTYLASRQANAYGTPGTMSIWNQLGTQGVGMVPETAGSSYQVN